MSNYKQQQDSKYIALTLSLLDTMPDFCMKFYDGKQQRLTPKTQWMYANRMNMFLHFLHDNVKYFEDKDISEYTLADLKYITTEDANNFVTYLNHKKPSKKADTFNKKETSANYIACISAYFTYFVKNRYLDINPFEAVENIKKRKKDLIYLDEEEQNSLLGTIQSGEGLSKRQKLALDKNMLRELCICSLLLDTGIRVSELVGIDIDDINMNKNMIYINRKGAKEGHVYFSQDMKMLLEEYLEFREYYSPTDDERALFLASTAKNKGHRLSVRSVQLLVKKYAIAAKIPKARQITPHKLRSSFAMDALKATGNLALVQKMLGHDNISTTTIYAQAEDSDVIEYRIQRDKNDE